MKHCTYLQIRIHAIHDREQYPEYQGQKHNCQDLYNGQQDGDVFGGLEDLEARGDEGGDLVEGCVDFAGVGDAHFDSRLCGLRARLAMVDEDGIGYALARI